MLLRIFILTIFCSFLGDPSGFKVSKKSNAEFVIQTKLIGLLMKQALHGSLEPN
jgi:hypothetical protein